MATLLLNTGTASYNELISNGRTFYVPPYQRDYSWEKEYWEDLWMDILDLPKEKYPQASEDEENIILLTLEEHDQVEMDMYRYDEVNERRNYLKIKYNL